MTEISVPIVLIKRRLLVQIEKAYWKKRLTDSFVTVAKKVSWTTVDLNSKETFIAVTF